MRIAYWLIFSLLFSISTLAVAQEQTPEQLLGNIKPSLVDIRATASKTFDEGNGHTVMGTYHAQGSGVILDSYGTIVTNTHIIANASHIFVGLCDGTVLEAKRVYSSDADFSFIKINPPYPLTPITWADSGSTQIGTPIIALTQADEDHQRILGGEITDIIYGATSNNAELFQINLTLIHGDSGGPLLDNQGHLLGLIMAKGNAENNQSYAIASDKIQQEYSQYQQNLPT